jgi:hypothetical protein
MHAGQHRVGESSVNVIPSGLDVKGTTWFET